MTHCVHSSQPVSTVTPAITRWAHGQSGHGDRNGGYAWAQQHRLLFTRVHCQVPYLLTAKTDTESLTPFSRVISKLPGGRLVTLDHFHHGGGKPFVLPEIDSLDTDLPSLHTVLLPKLPSIHYRMLCPPLWCPIQHCSVQGLSLHNQ